MGNIVIKELVAADKVSEIVDKINFNFDQLLLNGGGPPGPIGDDGEVGPIGPRGTIWFTVHDIYTTDSSPSWDGSPTQVNDENSTGYPQYSGNPNKYLPVGLGINPENTFIITNGNKKLKQGDLFIQSGEDNFNGEDTENGDIWEYDAINNEWNYTGLNIHGDQGEEGGPGEQQFIRESDNSDDILYPLQISGQNEPRVIIGTSIDPFDKIHPNAVSTFTSQGVSQIAIAHENIHIGSDTDKMATFTMANDGTLVLSGSEIGTSKQIIIQSDSSDIILVSGGDTNTAYTQSPSGGISPNSHLFTGGNIYIESPNNDSQHTFINEDDNRLDITINTSGYNSIDTGSNNLVLLNTGNKNVGIGNFSLGDNIVSKLSVNGNLSIGSAYKLINAPVNGAIIQNNTGIGTNDPNARLHVENNIGPVAINPIAIIKNNSTILGTRASIALRRGNETGDFTSGSYIFTDSDSTSILDYESRDINFITGGSIRVHIQPDGMVGIGTTAPQSLLNVNGNASIGYIDAAPIDGLIVEGNTGIGTNSPETQLHIEKSITNSDGLGIFRNIWNSSSSQSSIYLQRILDSGSGNNRGFKIQSGDNLTQLLDFEARSIEIATGTTPGSNSSRMHIDVNGNIGINTNSPMTKLDVNGKVNINDGIIQRQGALITNTTDLGLYSRVNGDYIRLVTNNGDIVLHTSDTPSGFEFQGERLRIKSSDGTVEVREKLQVDGNLRIKESSNILGMWAARHAISYNFGGGGTITSSGDADLPDGMSFLEASSDVAGSAIFYNDGSGFDTDFIFVCKLIYDISGLNINTLSKTIININQRTRRTLSSNNNKVPHHFNGNINTNNSTLEIYISKNKGTLPSGTQGVGQVCFDINLIAFN